MDVILVREPGLFTTVQDLGRQGFGPMGVSPSGAADAVSLRVGNRLVGNAQEAAGCATSGTQSCGASLIILLGEG